MRLLLVLLISLPGCTSHGEVYVQNYNEIDKEQFDIDFEECEKIAKGQHAAPTKEDYAQSAFNGPTESKPTLGPNGSIVAVGEGSEVASNAVTGMSMTWLKSRVDEGQAVRRCLKSRHYEVKGLQP